MDKYRDCYAVRKKIQWDRPKYYPWQDNFTLKGWEDEEFIPKEEWDDYIRNMERPEYYPGYETKEAAEEALRNMERKHTGRYRATYSVVYGRQFFGTPHPFGKGGLFWLGRHFEELREP